MRTDNQDFSAINQRGSKEPRRVVEIEFDASNIITLCSHTDQTWPTGTVYAGYLSGITSTSARVDPESARTTIGTLSFKALDIDENLTTYLRNQEAAGRGARHATVRYYFGYAGLPVEKFVLRSTQIVQKISYDAGEYSFSASDITREQRKQILEPKITNISATVEPGDTTINVADTSEFEMVAHGTSFSDAPSATVGYIQIGDEIIRYTGKTATSFTGCTRGAFSTVPERYEVGDESPDRREEVQEYIYLEYPAPMMIYALLTGTIYGTANTIPAHWHTGISPSLIRTADFTGIGADLWDTANDANGFIVRFAGITEVDGKRLIENEVLRLASLFSPVYSDGTIGLKRRANIGQDAPYSEILDENAVARVTGLTHDFTKVANVYRVDWNYNGDRYTRSNTLVDSDSVSAYGQAPTKIVKFKGLHGTRHTTSIVNSQIEALRDSFAGPPETCSVDLLHYLNTVEVGDIVRLRVGRVQDYQGNATNIDRSFEVHQVSIDDNTGRVRLRLFGSTRKVASTAQEGSTAAGDLPDAFYTSEGTSLGTALTVTDGGAGLGIISGSQTLAGGTDMNAAASIFYWDGDLELADGATLTITGNVQLRVRGFFDVRGTIDGSGGGFAGGSDPGTNRNIYPAATPGFIGTTRAFGGVLKDKLVLSQIKVPALSGQHSTFPKLEVRYDIDSAKLLGIPTDMRGTSGGPGGQVVADPNIDPSEPDPADGIERAGGAGGASGAGLSIICRGTDYNGSGSIDLSGDAGTVGTSVAIAPFVPLFYSGSGAGGAPGAMLVLLDGSGAVYPSQSGRFLASVGDIPETGAGRIVEGGGLYLTDVGGSGDIAGPESIGIQNTDLWQEAHRVLFVPPPEVPEEDVPGNLQALYYIKPTNGTAIKNGTGTLTIEARRLTENSDSPLVSGDIQLYDGASQLVGDGYTATFGEADINGSITIFLKDGPTGSPLDSLTLIDVDDGTTSEATTGSVEASEGLSWVYDANADSWAPVTLTTDLTATFYRGGAQVATRTVSVTNDGTGVLSHTDQGGTGETTSFSAIGNLTGALTIVFEHVDSALKVGETVAAILGGVDGVPGSHGTSVYTATIYKRAAAQPAKPANDEGSYDFDTLTLTAPSGWSVEPPDSDGNPLWACTGTFSVPADVGGVDGTVIWSLAKKFAVDGDTGPAGYNTATLTAYKWSNAGAPGDNPGAVTYTFDTAAWTPGNGWSATIPTSPGQGYELYAVSATAYSQSATDDIASGEWSSPSKVSRDPTDGSPGLNVATVYIFQRTAANSAPALPSVSSTYTFSSGALSGLNNGWASAAPANDGTKPYLWVSTATASNANSTDSIGSGEWAAAQLLSIDGDDGATSLPAPFSPGLVGGVSDISLHPNQLDGAAQPGEVYITGSRLTAPDGTFYSVSTANLLTPYGEGIAGRFFIVHNGNGDNATRFTTVAPSDAFFFYAIYDPATGWRAGDNGGSTTELFTPLATDTIVGAGRSEETTGGLDWVVSLMAGTTGDPGNTIGGANVSDWETFASFAGTPYEIGLRFKVDWANSYAYFEVADAGTGAGSPTYRYEVEVAGASVTAFTNETSNSTITNNGAPLVFGTDDVAAVNNILWGSNGFIVEENITLGGANTDRVRLTLDSLTSDVQFRLKVRRFDSDAGALSLGNRWAQRITQNGTVDETFTQVYFHPQDGQVVIWKGALASAPANPRLNWAYYNTTDGTAYIWDGDSWEVLSQDGTDGTSGTQTEFVFRRQLTRPSTPSGNGIPSGWSDDPPGGDDPLWMSSAEQEQDGTLIGSWSAPVNLDPRHTGNALNIGRKMNLTDQWWANEGRTNLLSTDGNFSIVTGTFPIWGTSLEVTGDINDDFYSELIPIDRTKRHRVSVWVRQTAGDRPMYLFVCFWDENGVRIPGDGDANDWPSTGTFAYFGLINSVGPADWTQYTREFGGDSQYGIPSNAAAISIGALVTRSTGDPGTWVTTTQQFHDYYVAEVAEPGRAGVVNYAGEYASFEDSPPFASGPNATPEIYSAGLSVFGDDSLRILADGSDAWVYFGQSTGDYHLRIPANKKWIFSAYVRFSTTNSPNTTNNVQLYLRPGPSGTAYSGTFSVPVDGNFHRISTVLDLTGNDDTSAILRVDNEGYSGAGTAYLYVDGVQLEVWDGANSPRDYVEPALARSVYTATVFKRSASAPATPSGGSYAFHSGTFTPPSGWSINPPASNGNPLYVSTATFSISGKYGTASSPTWASPELFVQDGTDGDSGLSVHVATIYRRATSAPSTPTTGSYDFGTKTLTPPSGWSQSIPSGTDPLYSSTGTFSVVGTTGTDNDTTWSTPAQIDGGGGAGGVSTNSSSTDSTYPPNALVSDTHASNGNPITVTITGKFTWSGDENVTPGGSATLRLRRRVNSGSWSEIASWQMTIPSPAVDESLSEEKVVSETAAGPLSPAEYPMFGSSFYSRVELIAPSESRTATVTITGTLEDDTPASGDDVEYELLHTAVQNDTGATGWSVGYTVKTKEV